MHTYPFVNLILRGFIYILLSRILRTERIKIIFVIWYSKSVIFLLVISWFFYSFSGFLIFRIMELEMNEFSTLLSSFRTIYCLFSINNFPDIAIKLMTQTTRVINRFIIIIYFVSFLLTNTFLLYGLLFALYYSNYVQVNKNIAIEFLRELK